MNKDSVMAALAASGVTRMTRKAFGITRLFDTFTKGRYSKNYWTTIQPHPWSGIVIAHPKITDISRHWQVIAHELVHVAQWRQLGWFGMVTKYATQRGRLELEAPAYATSVKIGHYSLPGAVKELKNNYFLPDISEDEIRAAIVERLNETERDSNPLR